MTVKVLSEQEVLREATEVLLEHLSPAQVARFCGWGNYLTLREAGETVTTLFDQVQAYQTGEA